MRNHRGAKIGVTLVAIGDQILPSIDIDEVERLGATLRNSMVWGPHKLSLSWNGTSWPLDTLIEDPQPILNEAGEDPQLILNEAAILSYTSPPPSSARHPQRRRSHLQC